MVRIEPSGLKAATVKTQDIERKPPSHEHDTSFLPRIRSVLDVFGIGGSYGPERHERVLIQAFKFLMISPANPNSCRRISGRFP